MVRTATLKEAQNEQDTLQNQINFDVKTKTIDIAKDAFKNEAQIKEKKALLQNEAVIEKVNKTEEYSALKLKLDYDRYFEAKNNETKKIAARLKLTELD